jgi:EAL domain-containing protein (putative c-di-GMP-specific phosphodiesterase class I)
VSVVAEAVETEEQWCWLVSHGVDYVQGYFFAKSAFPPSVSVYQSTAVSLCDQQDC